MSSTKLSHDELWPRAGGWQQPAGERTDLIIVGVPTSRTSLSPTNAHETPAAIRDALPGVAVTGVTGAIAFDENGDAKKDMAYLNIIEGGAFKFLKTVSIG